MLITQQRIAVWRTEAGEPHAVDAFCPHMGADLGNGRVQGNDLECYFHQWRFSGEGNLTGTRVGRCPKVSTRAWPAQDAHGWLWVYSAPVAHYPVPSAPGLEGRETIAMYLGKVTLFAHHHAMMAGGIDVQHFATVHNLDIDFQVDIDDSDDSVAEWHLEGGIPAVGWRGRLARALLGERFGYKARFAGGSMVGLTYGPNQRWRGTGRRLPPLHILWGCVAREDGVSDVHIFFLQPKRDGVRGWLKSRALLATTGALLTVLRDDDVKAFPYMRFDPKHLVPEDASVARLIQFIERLPISPWTADPAASAEQAP